MNKQLLSVEAAILGAGFYSLFTAYGYIANRTFDPGYNIIYLVRFFLGIVAGTILGTFADLSPQLKGVSPTVLGLIGGYSADAVNQILLRVSEVIVAAVKGSGKDDFTQREATLKAQAKEDQARQRQDNSKEMSDLLTDVAAKVSPDIVDRIKKTMDALNK